MFNHKKVRNYQCSRRSFLFRSSLLPPDLALQTRDYLPTLPSIGFTRRF